MKLVRYGPVENEKPGMIDANGNLRDLSALVSDFSSATLSDKLFKQLKGLTPTDLPKVNGQPRLGSPVSGTRLFVGVGLNYKDHALEINLPAPKEPILFLKSPHCIQGPNDPVMLPKDSIKTDWEVELGIVIGEKTRHVNRRDAFDHIFGYCLINDLSEREFQIEREGTWSKGKGCDTFGPIGPWLVTKDEIKDPQNLKLWLKVNGELMQSGSTSEMIFGVAELVSYISQFSTLYPGDIITSGTPAGVGLSRKPSPLFLKAGDFLSLGIDGLGEQSQTVIAFDQSLADTS